MTPPKATWSPEEVERLMILKAEGLNFVAIARKLGKNQNSVRSKWYQLNRDTSWSNVPNWSDAEDDLLFEMAETMPKSRLIAHYNSRAKVLGFPPRTLGGIKNRLYKLGCRHTPDGYYSRQSLSIALGLSYHRIGLWLERGLKSTQEGNVTYIKAKHLVKFILAFPAELEGIPPDGLQWFLLLLRDEVKIRA